MVPRCNQGLVAQDVDDEIAPRSKPAEKKKPARRKRPRLVPPHSRSSRYRGVYWEPKGSKWYSSISSNHKVVTLSFCRGHHHITRLCWISAVQQCRAEDDPAAAASRPCLLLLQQIHLGSFNTEEEAARAFDQEALRLRGPGTFTNFLPDDYATAGADSDGAGPPRRPLQKRPPNAIRQAAGTSPECNATIKLCRNGHDVLHRRRPVHKEGSEEEDEEVAGAQPEKDDQAANALLSLGSSIQRRGVKATTELAAPQSRPTPPRSIVRSSRLLSLWHAWSMQSTALCPCTSEGKRLRLQKPPVTLRGQKRKRGGLVLGAVARQEGPGRARSKYTGVYQQSRGSGWFASICVDKSVSRAVFLYSAAQCGLN